MAAGQGAGGGDADGGVGVGQVARRVVQSPDLFQRPGIVQVDISIYGPKGPWANRIGFDLERIMRTRYRIDTYQKTYFVIDSYEQLMKATEPDFTPIYAELAAQESIPAGQIVQSDFVYNRGSGEGWSSDGDV